MKRKYTKKVEHGSEKEMMQKEEKKRGKEKNGLYLTYFMVLFVSQCMCVCVLMHASSEPVYVCACASFFSLGILSWGISGVCVRVCVLAVH